MLAAGRHVLVHLGGALVACAAVCAFPVLLANLLGPRWPMVFLPVVLAAVLAVVGFAFKVVRWLRAPVPFRVPLTVGQQHGLATLGHAATGSPHRAPEVWLRVVLDVLLFRPLLRPTPSATLLGRGLSRGAGWLWLAAALFHAALAVVLLRHLRLFLEPVPGFVTALERVDLATEMVLPKLHLTTVVLPLALLALLGRRLARARLRTISLAADYFPLLLLLAIVTTGVVMRHIASTDVTAAKQLVLGLAHGTLTVPDKLDAWLLVHLFLVAALLAHFPVSKLMHFPGALVNPTLIMANTNRERRHVNARNPRVTTLPYAAYEATFRQPMIDAGLPVEGAVRDD